MKPEALQTDSGSWRKDISGEVVETFADPELNYLAGSFAFEVVCRHKRKRILSATARYLVSYKTDGVFNIETGTLFVERVGRVVAYPYFRTVVASLASQAGLQMPPLPIISLAPRTVSSAADLEENGPVKVLRETRPKK